jgi:CHAT domain-containing protein
MKLSNVVTATLLLASMMITVTAMAMTSPEKAGASTIKNTDTEIDRRLSVAGVLAGDGRHDLAVEELEGLLPVAKAQGTPLQQMKVLNRLGSLLTPIPYPVAEGSMATNETVRSLKTIPADKGKDCLTEALAMARAAGDLSMTASILNNLGTLYLTRKQYEQAAFHYLESVQLARQAGGGELLGSVLANLGRLQVSAGSPAEAINTLEEAQRIWAALPDSTDKAAALIGIGQNFRRIAAAAAGDKAGCRLKAIIVLDSAARTAAALENARLLSYALGYSGGVAEDSADSGQALSLTRQALFHAQKVNSPDLLYLWQWQLGRILQQAGDNAAALTSYRMAVRSLQTVRRSIRSDSAAEVLSFREMVEPVYLGLTELLLRESDAAASPETMALFLKEAQETIENLRTAELQEYFRDSCIGDQSRGGVFAAPARTALIYLITFSTRLELLLSLPSGMKHIASPFSAEEVAAQAGTFARYLATASGKSLVPAARLYDMVIRPIEGELQREQIEHLVIIPDGILRTVPLAAFYDGKEFLVSRYSISTTQGLQLVNTSPSAAPAHPKVLMAGISESVSGFPALPSVLTELDGIGTMFSSKILLNKSFLKNSLKNEIERVPYTYIHLATHGEFTGDRHNMFILAWDGLITADNLNSFIRPTKYRGGPIELLTLSACKTAVGDDRAALGLAGIAVKAGSKSTIAALWEIEDRVTAELIQEFYRNLKQPGMSKALALQKAQLAIMQHHQHPFFWAPFVLIGNWR